MAATRARTDSRRERAPTLAWTLALALACAACSRAPVQAGGLELLIATNLTAPSQFDSITLQIQQRTSSGQWGPALIDTNFLVPGEATLPTTFAVAAGRSADQVVLIQLEAVKGGVAVDLRQVEVQVPTTRVASLTLILAESCLGQVTTVGGQVMSTCASGQSCQPATGTCGPTTIMTPLSTYDGGLSVDASVGAFLRDAGSPDGASSTTSGSSTSSRGTSSTSKSTSASQAGDAGKGMLTVPLPTFPASLAIDSHGNVWAGLSSSNPGNNLVKVSREGLVLGMFTVPADVQGVAVDENDDVWVTSENSQTVTKLAQDGTLLGTSNVGDPGHSIGVAIDRSGNAWVANPNPPVESPLLELSPSGMSLGHFTVTANNPWSVAIDNQGNVWVTNPNVTSTCGDARLCEGEGMGTAVNKISSAGTALGKYTLPNGPEGIAIDSKDNVWVASVSGAVTKMSNTGHIALTVHSSDFAGPWGVAIDSADDVWVTNGGNNLVVELNSEGAKLATLIVPAADGGMSDSEPIALDRSQPYVWVGNFLGKSLTRFDTGGPVARCRSSELCP